jgi:hypothetical protein
LGGTFDEIGNSYDKRHNPIPLNHLRRSSP